MDSSITEPSRHTTMGAIGSRGFWRQSSAAPPALTTSRLRGRLPATPGISDPAGIMPPWLMVMPPVFSLVLDLRVVDRPLPPVPELPVAIESVSSLLCECYRHLSVANT